MNEEWRPIINFENCYEVSSEGRVRSTLTRQGSRAGHVLKPRSSASAKDKSHGEYWRVALHFNGIRMDRDIHTIVATAFLGAIPEGLEINHKDGNKKNNALNNLEYVSHSYNVKHAWDKGLRKYVGNTDAY